MRKYRDTILVIIERRRYNLVSEPNIQTTKFFTENLLATEMKKTEIRLLDYHGYLIDDCSEDKKVKSTKKCIIKGKRKFESYESSLEETQLENKASFLKKIKLIYS